MVSATTALVTNSFSYQAKNFVTQSYTTAPTTLRRIMQ